MNVNVDEGTADSIETDAHDFAADLRDAPDGWCVWATNSGVRLVVRETEGHCNLPAGWAVDYIQSVNSTTYVGVTRDE